MRSTACRSHVSLCSFKTCSVLAAQPDWGVLWFLFHFFFISLCLNYCGQAALGHFSLSLSLCSVVALCLSRSDTLVTMSCYIDATADTIQLDYEFHYFAISAKPSYWTASFACGDFSGWWLSQNCKAALSLWLFYAHTCTNGHGSAHRASSLVNDNW